MDSVDLLENINIAEVCRACFETCKHYKFLCDKAETIENQTLADVFFDVVKMEVKTESESPPTRICLPCSYDLENAYNFIQKSQKNNERLIQLLMHSNTKQASAESKIDIPNDQNISDTLQIKIEEEILQDNNHTSLMEHNNSSINSFGSDGSDNESLSKQQVKNPKLECTHCNRIFNKQNLFEDHMRSHIEEDVKKEEIEESEDGCTFECYECNFCCNSDLELEKHQQSEHTTRQMFIIVKHKRVIEAIPAAWAVIDQETQNEIVYWPRKNLKAKRLDLSCIPDVHDSKEWFAGTEKVIKRNFKTWEEANAEAVRLLNSDSGTFESENNQSKRFTRRNQHSVSLVNHKVIYPTKICTIPSKKLATSTHIHEIKQSNDSPQGSTSIHSSTTAEAHQQSDANYGNKIATEKTYISENITGNNIVLDMADGSYQPLKQSEYSNLQCQNDDSQQISSPAAKEIATTADQSIIGILSKLSNQVVTLQQGMQLLLAGKNDGAGKCPDCFHCNPSLLHESRSMAFDKIKSEDALINLENLIANEEYKQNFIKFCFGIIGIERNKDDLVTCCLELSREIFDKTFWSQTTWLGTTHTGGTKFSLCKHETFINLFKFIICKTTSATPAKQFFAQFFQGRTKNCIQQLKANDSRHPGQRKRAKTAADGISGSKKMAPNIKNMVNIKDDDLCRREHQK